jgi:hypothetical protein
MLPASRVGFAAKALIIITLALAGLDRVVAQTATFTGSVSIAKQTTIRQTSASAVQEEGCLLTVRASFPTPLPAFNIELRGTNGSLNLLRTETGGFLFQQSYVDRAALERALPAGPCTLVTPSGDLTFIIPANASTADAKITNFDELQRWNGRTSVAVTIAPTAPGMSVPLSNANTVLLGITQPGTFDGLGGAGPLTAPSTTITAEINEFRIPNTAPGDVLPGRISFSTFREVSGSAPQSTLSVTFNCAINFPVTRAHLPPQITTHPIGQTVNAGSRVSLSVVASGNGLGYLWLKDSIAIAGATNSVLVLPNPQPGDSGAYYAVVTNTGGVAISSPATVTVNAVTTPPVVVVVPPTVAAPPVAAALLLGAGHQLTVTATGTAPFSYQWFRDAAPIPGATASSLTLQTVRLSDAGSYTVVVRNSAGSITSAPVTVTVALISRISNLSIRTRVGGTSGILTVGLTVGGGEGDKPMLLRAIGPTLSAFGIETPLADPQIALLAGAIVLAQNDDWGGGTALRTAAASVGAFPLPSTTSRDAALLPNAAAGSYTVRITAPPAGAPGITLAEVYDTTPAETFFFNTPRLINVSALTQAGAGSDTLIAGFAIAGSAPKSVLVRGIGPALSGFGVGGALADPKLEVYSSDATTPIAVNDDWGAAPNSADVARVAVAVGAFSLGTNAKDAALLLTLPPGSYTAQVTGVNNATGTALVEIYEAP